MSPLAFYRQMITSGMDEATAYKLAEQFETEEGAKADARYEALLSRLASPSDKAADKRREWDRQRKADQLAAKNSGGNPVESTRPPVEPVEIHPTKAAPAPVHTRGEETLPKLVDKPNLTTPNSAGDFDDLDWPDSDKPSRAYLDRLEDALRDAAGPALASAAIAPKVKVLAAILALGRAGRGPPCDMQADVLPTVRARCARAPPASVKGWDYFTEAIREARDKRLTGAPAVETLHQGPRHERPDQPTAKLLAKQRNMESSFRGAQSAAARRAI